MAFHQLFAVLGLNLEQPLDWACNELFRGGMEHVHTCAIMKTGIVTIARSQQKSISDTI